MMFRSFIMCSCCPKFSTLSFPTAFSAYLFPLASTSFTDPNEPLPRIPTVLKSFVPLKLVRMWAPSSTCSPTPFLSATLYLASPSRSMSSRSGPSSNSKTSLLSIKHTVFLVAVQVAARFSSFKIALSPKNWPGLLYINTSLCFPSMAFETTTCPYLRMKNESPLSPCLMMTSPSANGTSSRASAMRERSNLVSLSKFSTFDRNRSYSSSMCADVFVLILLKVYRSMAQNSDSVSHLTVALRSQLYISAISPKLCPAPLSVMRDSFLPSPDAL
mmetsp:Transcript_30946/g.75462  ORF Transcript_30946/g.75462 Transcript_30946/m.75462 type:complete len:273 (-) Transcript_30946:919-1737(-)